VTPATFWAALDTALRDLDAAGIPAMGPEGLPRGIEDCLTCTLAELEVAGLADGPFVFYHSQDYNPTRAQCHLAWASDETRFGSRPSLPATV
jgi:hypothetical protein